jgi:hypothetical protein
MAVSRKSSKKCSRGSSGVKSHTRSSGKKVKSFCRKSSHKKSRKTSHKKSHKKSSCPEGKKRQRVGSYMRNGKKVKGHFRCIDRAM